MFQLGKCFEIFQAMSRSQMPAVAGVSDAKIREGKMEWGQIWGQIRDEHSSDALFLRIAKEYRQRPSSHLADITPRVCFPYQHIMYVSTQRNLGFFDFFALNSFW